MGFSTDRRCREHDDPLEREYPIIDDLCILFSDHKSL